jgi:hypothetical protein
MPNPSVEPLLELQELTSIDLSKFIDWKSISFALAKDAAKEKAERKFHLGRAVEMGAKISELELRLERALSVKE